MVDKLNILHLHEYRRMRHYHRSLSLRPFKTLVSTLLILRLGLSGLAQSDLILRFAMFGPGDLACPVRL